MRTCIYQNSRSYREELHCFDNLRNYKHDTLRSSERFISNITCSTFEEIRQKKTFKAFKADQLEVFNTRNRIIWRFNLAKAPWWGLLFEPLIHSTKRSLRKSMRNCTLNYEKFSAVLVEIEEASNSRPLTYFDKDDIEEPLTPFHL